MMWLQRPLNRVWMNYSCRESLLTANTWLNRVNSNKYPSRWYLQLLLFSYSNPNSINVDFEAKNFESDRFSGARKYFKRGNERNGDVRKSKDKEKNDKPASQRSVIDR